MVFNLRAKTRMKVGLCEFNVVGEGSLNRVVVLNFPYILDSLGELLKVPMLRFQSQRFQYN
jgi:hypothetical protein